MEKEKLKMEIEKLVSKKKDTVEKLDTGLSKIILSDNSQTELIKELKILESELKNSSLTTVIASIQHFVITNEQYRKDKVVDVLVRIKSNYEAQILDLQKLYFDN